MTSLPRIAFTSLFVLAALGLPAVAKTKAPVAGTTFFPAGAQRGMTSIITLTSSIDPVNRQVAIDCPGVQLVSGAKDQVQVAITPDAPLGLHLLHVYNDQGCSEPRWFSIGTLPEIEEHEPNDSLGEEQFIDSLPVCINGRLGKHGDADLFAFQLREGETLTASLEAYALGSLVDAFLQLRDDQNNVLATAHDGRNLDPVLVFKAPRLGRYSLELAGFNHPPAADVAFTGGPAVIYRLHLTTGPATLRLFPAVVSRTSPNHLDMLGAGSTPIDFDGSRLPPEPLIQLISPPNALGPVQVAVTDSPVLREVEPNNELGNAMPLAVPGCVAGRIDKPGDVDRFSFQAKKGVSYTVRLLAKALGLPLDAFLTLTDSTGKELARNDDATDGDDPLLNWKAPADGTYQVVVTDLFNRGGEAAEYVLTLGPGEETFAATITSKNVLSIEAGKTVELKASLKRIGGFSGSLTARVIGLPPGVIANEVTLTGKTSDIALTLRAAANTASSNGPIQLVLATTGDKAALLTRTATIDLRGEIRRGTSALDRADYVWLTVIPAKPALPPPFSPAK